MTSTLDELIHSLDEHRQALLGDLEGLSPEVLQARPRPEAWSILEIFEHLVVAESVILHGLPPYPELEAKPRTLAHRIKFLLVSLVLRWRIPVKVPTRRMLPTGQRSLGELRVTWDGHLAWLRGLVSAHGEAARTWACFTHPVAGPITLAQALRLDLLHLQIHHRQITRLRQPSV